MDPNEAAMEVHADPGLQGYGSVSRFERGSQIVSKTIPGLVLAINKILTPQQPNPESQWEFVTLLHYC